MVLWVNSRVRHPELAGTQEAGGTRQTQGAEVVIGNQRGASGAAGCANRTQHGAGRGIEAGVVGHVAEVAFVADPVAATDAALAVAAEIVRKANARCSGAPTRSPELADRTLVGNVHASVSDLLFKAGTRTVVKIGVQAGNVVVLYAVVLVAQAVVDGQPRSGPKTILGIDVPVLVAIAPSVLSRTQRRSDRALRGFDQIAIDI